jgi:pimeloyl-ACP methyl ester carboxylesterase
MAPGTSNGDGHSLLDDPDVLNTLFHPRPDVGDRQSPDLEIPVAAGVSLGASLFPAEADSPLIILFHGNGELASDYEDIAPAYNRIGVTLLVVDYRGYGFSTGKPTASSTLHDARVVYHDAPTLLHDLELDCNRVFIMGRSLGSAPAIDVASRVRHKLCGLIIESGFSYTFPLIQRLGGPALTHADEKRDGFGNLEKVEHVEIPTLVIHGEEDHIIPVTDGMALHRRCKSHDKRMLVIPHAGHNDLLMRDARSYFQAIDDLVRSSRPNCRST